MKIKKAIELALTDLGEDVSILDHRAQEIYVGKGPWEVRGTLLDFRANDIVVERTWGGGIISVFIPRIEVVVSIERGLEHRMELDYNHNIGFIKW